MLVTPPRNQAPRASAKKRAVFTFHLLQPFFQFVALMIVMLAFARCSPLAPSTDKEYGLGGGGHSGGGGLSGAVLFSSAAEAQALEKSLSPIGSGKAAVISETDFRRQTEDVKSADDSLDDASVKFLLDRQARRKGARAGKLLFLNLSPEQTASLIKEGKLRLDLGARLVSAPDSARGLFVSGLETAQRRKNLRASSFLVMPDGVARSGQYQDLSLPVRVAFGAPVAGKGFLELSYQPSDDASSDANATLLDAALRDARALAITLE